MFSNEQERGNTLDEPTLSVTELKDIKSSLGSYGTNVIIQSDDLIVNYGDTTTSIDILVEGEALVEIFVQNKWITVAWLKPGSVIGEISFLDSQPRTARVKARTQCNLFRINRESFVELSENEPKTALGFMTRISTIIAYRLRRIEQFDAVEQGRDDMRKELAADLHDQTMSELSAILMHLGLMKMSSTSDKNIVTQIEEIVGMVKNADLNLRQLVKEKGHDDVLVVGIDQSIVKLLQSLEDSISDHHIKVSYQSNEIDEGSLPVPLAQDLFHIIRQALLNSIKHSQSDVINIIIYWDSEGISFSVKDNGVGFEEKKISNVPQAGHFGLLNLKLRAERTGGNVEVLSQKGMGTEIKGHIPVSRKTDTLTYKILERKFTLN
jgi:signal transduction histidine kinase